MPIVNHYFGQVSHNLKQSYQEHVKYTRNDDPQSAYAAHILNLHVHGPINNNISSL